jgi:hypothetical protein
MAKPMIIGGNPSAHQPQKILEISLFDLIEGKICLNLRALGEENREDQSRLPMAVIARQPPEFPKVCHC